MTNHQANISALQTIMSAGFQGPVTATSRFEDERLELEKAVPGTIHKVPASLRLTR